MGRTGILTQLDSKILSLRLCFFLFCIVLPFKTDFKLLLDLLFTMTPPGPWLVSKVDMLTIDFFFKKSASTKHFEEAEASTVSS